MGQLRAGIEQVPEGAIQCLKENLGEGVIQEIQDGSFMPGPKTGETIKSCFNKVLPELKAKMQEGLKQAPPETISCLKNKLGNEGYAKIEAGEMPDLEAGDAMKECFETMKTEGLNRMKEGLSQMPSEIKDCVAENIGREKLDRIKAGDTNIEIGPEIGEAMKNCADNFKNVASQKMEEGLAGAPPEIRECIKSKIGDGKGDIQSLVKECMANFKPEGLPEGLPVGVPEGIEIPLLEEMQQKYKEILPSGIPPGIPEGIPGALPNNIPIPQMPTDIPAAPLNIPNNIPVSPNAQDKQTAF